MAESRSALIVATSEYEDKRLTPLGGPGRDAEALEAVLKAADIGGFDVQLALNAQHDDLRTTLEGFFADRGREDLLLLHFSGHGLKDDDGQLYLAAADTRIDRLMSTGIEAGWVNRLMTRSRSEKIALFLDCCFGGAFTAGLTRRAGVDTAGANETFHGTGRFVITASDAMQYSFESGELVDDKSPQPSPFTSALVEGLRTGEADRNDDGLVSINELYDYLEEKVHQLSPSQTPTKSAFNQIGDWVIARSTRGPTIRILPASVQAHLNSDQPLERMTAVIDLRDLIEASDERMSEAARKALEKLTGDDSKAVAAVAARVFGEIPARAGGGTVVSTPISRADVPQEIKDALTTEPTADIVKAAEIATAPMRSPEATTDEATELEKPKPETPKPQTAEPETKYKPPPAASTPSPATPADPEAPTAPSPPSRTPVTEPAADEPPPGASQPMPPTSGAGAGSSDIPGRTPPETARPPTAGGGALWGPSKAPGTDTPQAPATTPATIVASPPWSLARAFARAGFAAFLGLALASVYYILEYASYYDIAQYVLGCVVSGAVFGGVVAGVERFIPQLRIPGGSAYGAVRNNGWAVSLLLGLLAGVLFLPLVGIYDVVFVVAFVVAFFIAEAVFGRRFSAATAAKSA